VIFFSSVLEPVFGDRDGMRAAAPFPNKTRAGFEAEAWCGGNPAHCPQGLRHGLQLAPGRLGEPALGDLLKSVTKSENKQIAADPRRLPLVKPPPFAAQVIEAKGAKAIDRAPDRFRVHRCHG
jgi:hypothetical protein